MFSKTIDRAPWGSFEAAKLTEEDPREEIPRLRAREGKDIVVWGSLTLVQSLAEASLVDEYQLWVLPLVLGSGRPLFAEGVGSFTIDSSRRSRRTEGRPYFAMNRADHLVGACRRQRVWLVA